MMRRISLTSWPMDSRDSLSILARALAQEHFAVQMSLLKFNLAADTGDHISDGTYMHLLAALARLSLVGSELRAALMAYRTTAKMPAVQNGGDSL